MKLFTCQNCQNVLYFENASCERCGARVGYIPELEVISAVTPEEQNWIALADPGKRFRFCTNWEMHACNWLIDAARGDAFCAACSHNRKIPDVTDPGRHLLWQKMETAKRRVFYSLIKLQLPLPRPDSGDPEPLVFDFLNETPGKKVSTGHDDGIITINLIEANDADRERLRTSMHEPYRTLLGHFRHELGHFYWDRLVRDGHQLDACRKIFGDDRTDYAQAMAKYYDQGPQPEWQENFVSAYATMHPWEDFAETWAHYLHIVDTLEMAFAFGMSLSPRVHTDEKLEATIDRNPYRATRIDELLTAWLPITFAVNSLNRTMGQPDLYPFVLSPPAIRKLDFVRELCWKASS